jgi:hypothetical protein
VQQALVVQQQQQPQQLLSGAAPAAALPAAGQAQSCARSSAILPVHAGLGGLLMPPQPLLDVAGLPDGEPDAAGAGGAA